ncbi:hypothetical protein ACFL6U_29055 [Planctomycetota bacterium]
MLTEKKNKRIEHWVMVLTSGLILAALCTVLVSPKTALAKKPPKPDPKPEPVVLGDAWFVEDAGFGGEVEGGVSEATGRSYRTVFGTGNVVVTLSDGTILDHKPFLMRFTDDTTGDRHLAFRIGLQGGHHVKDRYSTPTPAEGIGDPALAIPFPETAEDPGDGSPWLEEIVAGSVDANLDMLPGAHVILHLHVTDIPLVRLSGPDAGDVIGTISVGDIEFTYPE